jgi:hypothetical protein
MPIFYLPYLWYIKGLLSQLWSLAALFFLLLINSYLCRCLQDCPGELSRQTSHQMLLQLSLAYQQLALSANEAWEQPAVSTPWDLINFQNSGWLNKDTTQQEADSLISTHNTNKRLVFLGCLAFLGWVEGPEVNTKNRSPDLWLLAKLPCLFPCLQNLRNFQFLN